MTPYRPRQLGSSEEPQGLNKSQILLVHLQRKVSCMSNRFRVRKGSWSLLSGIVPPRLKNWNLPTGTGESGREVEREERHLGSSCWDGQTGDEDKSWGESYGSRSCYLWRPVHQSVYWGQPIEGWRRGKQKQEGFGMIELREEGYHKQKLGKKLAAGEDMEDSMSLVYTCWIWRVRQSQMKIDNHDVHHSWECETGVFQRRGTGEKFEKDSIKAAVGPKG